MNRTRIFAGILITIALAGCVSRRAPAPPVTEPPVDTTAVAPAPVPMALVRPETYAERSLRSRSNVRTEPGTGAPIVATLPARARIGLVEVRDGWFRIAADTMTGWIWAPLVAMTANDRWDAAMSYAIPRMRQDGLFSAKYRDEKGLVIVLDIAWRDMARPEKLRVVEETGRVWKDAAGRMGIEPPPEIHFMSNNEYEMARWHGFWGAQVYH